MSADFFVREYLQGHKRYCEGLKSQVARDLFKVGTKHGEAPQGIFFGLSAKFINSLEKTPYSSKDQIVIPWISEREFDYELTGYDKTPFNPDVVDYKISGEEFDAVINDLKRNEYWIPQYTLPLSLSMGMLVAPLILMALWGVVLMHGMDPNHPLLYLIIIIICPALSLVNFLSPVFIYRANISRLEKREEEFSKILDSWNERVFNDRKVAWKSGQYGCWLELNFEKEIPSLEEYSDEMKDSALEDLQIEYRDLAKQLGVNVSGQKVGLEAIGCFRKGKSSSKPSRSLNTSLGLPENDHKQITPSQAPKIEEDDLLDMSTGQLGDPLAPRNSDSFF